MPYQILYRIECRIRTLNTFKLLRREQRKHMLLVLKVVKKQVLSSFCWQGLFYKYFSSIFKNHLHIIMYT